MITETDEIARALDDAAKQWPEERDSRGRLLRRLIAEGHKALRKEREEYLAERERAIRDTSGALTGVYHKGYLEELRADWPE